MVVECSFHTGHSPVGPARTRDPDGTLLGFALETSDGSPINALGRTHGVSFLEKGRYTQARAGFVLSVAAAGGSSLTKTIRIG